MVFFSSKHRVDQLPLIEKAWMYPVGYLLKLVAGGIVKVVDKFDETVANKIVKWGEN